MIYRKPVKTIEGTINRAISVLENYGWTKGFAARDAKDIPVKPEDSSATKFCMWGSIFVSNSLVSGEAFSDLNKYIENNLMFSGSESTAMFEFNDACKSKRQVIKVLKDFLKTQHGK